MPASKLAALVSTMLRHALPISLPAHYLRLGCGGAQPPVHFFAVVRSCASFPLPSLQVWWDTAPNSLRATLWMLLADLPADLPLLLFATADVPVSGGQLSVAPLQCIGWWSTAGCWPCCC